MNDFVEYIFAFAWHYTKLTFRLLWWLVRFIAAIISRILNQHQNVPSTQQSDLFDQSSSHQEKEYPS
jgi:hypothetical protein